MKKIIVPVFAVLFAFGSLNASNINTENVIIETSVPDITSFCRLIQKGNIEAVKAMIKSGENVNQKSKGLTPLMFAARHNRSDIAKLLIANGANLKIRSDKGKMTALDMAKKFKANETMEVIKVAVKSKKKKK